MSLRFRPLVLLALVLLCAACAANSRRRGSRGGTDAGSADASVEDDASTGTDSGPPASCSDGIRNGDETRIDCGGSCEPCPDGSMCRASTDCLSGVCVGGYCLVPTCDDSVHNGEETGVDCGSACPACPGGEGCAVDGDCLSMICEEGVCAETSCADGTHNADETDVDCGGETCPPCAATGACLEDRDCESRICDGGACTAPTCTDGVQNGDESDVDCGGSACDPCPDGRACGTGDDCASLVCTDGTCDPPTCTDGVQNGDESDVDCGGGTCDPCTPGDTCVAGTDCDSGVCTGGTCRVPSCTDGVVNGGETDVDCGGATACPRCPDGSVCVGDSDCVAAECSDRMRCGSCAIIDDFETGSWPYAPWLVETAGGSVTTAAAHDGTYGLQDPDWHYRTDVTVGAAGDRLRMWVRAASSGRAYFGFGATASGAKSFVLAPNTTSILFQNNSGYGYSNVATSTTSFSTGAWYLMEIEFLGGGMVRGTVYSSDGVTVVNTLTHDFGTLTPAGIALRSFNTTYLDTIEVCY